MYQSFLDVAPAVIDWSRAQFALTAAYHWLFVPLTLGLAVIMGIAETIYYKNGRAEWLALTRFWQKLFGINFAIGVATGIILEFEFGTNWSNYSWFVGDIFGAPLAIEGIVAFFMESTFVAVMFFGWKKVSRASTSPRHGSRVSAPPSPRGGSSSPTRGCSTPSVRPSTPRRCVSR